MVNNRQRGRYTSHLPHRYPTSHLIACYRLTCQRHTIVVSSFDESILTAAVISLPLLCVGTRVLCIADDISLFGARRDIS